MAETKYLRSEDGDHSFCQEPGETNWLHVLLAKKDRTVHAEQTKEKPGVKITMIQIHEVTQGTSLINRVEKPRGECTKITREEFESVLREAIFNLGIYKYTVPVEH